MHHRSIGLRAYRRLTLRANAHRHLCLLAATAAIFSGSSSLFAFPSYTWDPNGGASGTGGTGNWDTSSNFWQLNGALTTWPTSGTDNTAIFGGTGGVVTLTTAIAVNRLNFTAAGYSLAGAFDLTLNGTNPTFDTGGFNVDFNLGANHLKRATGTTAASTITKTGVGILTLDNNQTTSLGTNVTWNVNGGTVNNNTGLYDSGLAFPTGTSLGTLTGNVVNLDNAMIQFTKDADSGYAAGRVINIGSKGGGGGAIYDGGFAPGNGVIVANSSNVISPTVNIANATGLNLVSGKILQFDGGSFNGGGSIATYGAGVVKILSTNNTYTGGTTINPGSTVLIGGNRSLGTGDLTLNGTLDLNSTNLSIAKFTSNSGRISYNPNATSSTLNATSAAVSGTTRINLPTPTLTSVNSTNTKTVITSTGGGLAGSYVGSFALAGGQNLSIPVQAAQHTVNSVTYRLAASVSANAQGTATTLTITDAVAPARVLNIMPLGSSITSGISAQSPYDGGGYRSQLYQNLVNDGRFTVNFVGSSVTTGANHATGPDLMTTVGQTHHEGHSGYRTDQVLNNLNANDGSGDNDGGFWLKPGNGVNPDYITQNVGGNDYVQNRSAASVRANTDSILNSISSLRPNATVVLSTLIYRGDNANAVTGPNGFENTFNPIVSDIVYQHVLAGQHVIFLDGDQIVSPTVDGNGNAANRLANIGPDLVHPTQTGYNLYADGWYKAITTGQAFFTGAQGAAWNSGGNGATSFDFDFQRTTDARVLPSANTDVYFNGGGVGGSNGGATTLGANFSIRSVNFAAGATNSVTIGGNNTLTLGVGGITVQAGTGAHTISSAVSLGGVQSWSNVSSSRFTVSGNVSGSSALTIGGTGVIVLSGSNSTFNGGTTITGGTLVAANSAGSATGLGAVLVKSGSTLTGTGSASGAVDVFGTISAGLADGSVGTLSTGSEIWEAAGRFVSLVSPDGIGHDRLNMTSLTVASTSASQFIINITGSGTTILPTARLILASDSDTSAGNPFNTSTFTSSTLPKLSLLIAGVQPTSGFAFKLDTQIDGPGYDLVLTQTAVPEPATMLLAAVPVMLLRRRGS